MYEKCWTLKIIYSIDEKSHTGALPYRYVCICKTKLLISILKSVGKCVVLFVFSSMVTQTQCE